MSQVFHGAKAYITIDGVKHEFNSDVHYHYRPVNLGLLVRKIYSIKTKRKRIVNKYIKRFKGNSLADHIIRMYETGDWKL
jgi:hypothetical protein